MKFVSSNFLPLDSRKTRYSQNSSIFSLFETRNFFRPELGVQKERKNGEQLYYSGVPGWLTLIFFPYTLKEKISNYVNFTFITSSENLGELAVARRLSCSKTRRALENKPNTTALISFKPAFQLKSVTERPSVSSLYPPEKWRAHASGTILDYSVIKKINITEA